MTNQQSTNSWVLSPGGLIDRVLDHMERLSSVLVPDKVDNPPYMDAGLDARLEQLGAPIQRR
jgi:hypothetical protein